MNSSNKRNDFSVNFRIFRKSLIETVRLRRSDNSILFEMILKAHVAGMRLAEIPVTFRERRFGRSKLKLFSESLKFFMTLFSFFPIRWKRV